MTHNLEPPKPPLAIEPNTTPRGRLFSLFDSTVFSCRETMARKNADYSGGTEDPYANFTTSKFLGVRPELGILMRVMDKFQRIRAFVHKGELQVKSESVEDAIDDSINYLILLKGYIRETAPEQPTHADLIHAALRGDR